MYVAFVPKEDYFPATAVYVDTICEVAAQKYGQCDRVERIKDIHPDDVVLVITLRTYFLLRLKRPKQRFIMWFQGILPEELKLQGENGLRGRLKQWLFPKLEKRILREADLLLFVSDSMRQHYEKKYTTKLNNYFLMPCFNQLLDESSFDYAGKYENPSFVYIGNLMAWQCFEQTVETFCAIKQQLPNATFSVLTGDIDKARKILARYQLMDVEVKFVPLAQLQEELKRFKYGFILREDTPVNNVATPTKLNSYMASGIIPIFSSAVHDFHRHLRKNRFAISLREHDYVKETLQEVMRIEHGCFSTDEIKNEFRIVFKTYYSIDSYKRTLRKKL